MQAVRNILPYLQDEALVFTLSKIANNFRLMSWNCIRWTEYPCRFPRSGHSSAEFSNLDWCISLDVVKLVMKN